MVKQEKIFCNIELTKNEIFLFKVVNRDAIIRTRPEQATKTRHVSKN